MRSLLVLGFSVCAAVNSLAQTVAGDAEANIPCVERLQVPGLPTYCIVRSN
jgi:hypothetical protein